MNDNQHIPSGYKPSPLGIIPEDWEVKRLGDIGEVLMCKRIMKYQTDSFGDIPFFKIGTFGGKADAYISREVFDEYKTKYSYPKVGDVLISAAGTIGRSVIFDGTPSYYQDSNIVWIDNDNKQVLNKYLYYYYSTINWITDTGTIPRLYNGALKAIQIPTPPIEQQARIVSILELWDTAIAKQTALIEQLTLRKRGLMQQLLTGKKRLKGFEGKWEKCAIKSFAKEVSIRNTDNKDYVVLSCTKYDGLVPSLEYFGKQIYSNDLSTYKVVPKNHFAYATNHIEEGSIGYQAYYNNGLISPMYTVFETDKEKVDDTYLFAVLKSHHLIYLYQAMMEGSINRRGGLRWDSFSTIKVDLPSLEEQKAISAFLHNADKEIEIQKQKLAALQEQKKGLMQVLLTGKKRIN